MARKSFYYIGVQTNDGMSLVTKIDNKSRQCFWDTEQKPLTLPLSVATNIAEELMFNFIQAVVIKSFIELEHHFICRKEGDENVRE